MAHNVWQDWREMLERENKGREFRESIQEGAAFTGKRLQEMSRENNVRGAIMRYVAGGAGNVGKGYKWLAEPLKYAAEEGDRIAPGVPTGQAFLGQLLLSAESLGQTLHERSGRGAEMLATGEELYNPFTKKRIGQLPDLGLDVPLTRGIAQGVTGIASEIFLEKGLGKGLKALDRASNLIPPKSPRLIPALADGSTTVTRNVDDFTPSNVLQSKSYTAQSGNAEIIRRQQLDKPLSADIDPDEMIRRQTLKPPGFRMDRKQIKAEIVKLQDKGMSLEDAKKHLLGDGETFWIDNRTGEPISIQYNSKDPNNPHMVGWWSRGKRGGKRTLLTEQQSVGPGETAFTKYNAKTNKVELLVKKGDEIHHWNSIIDKSSAYVGLSTQEAKELTGLVREAGWMFGDNKANLIKMIRSDHKKIHAFMRENGIEGVTARKMMEKLYAGKSVKERFKILRGFMEHVQGAVDEELVRMGYQIPASHAAAQAANREVLKTIKMP